MSWLDNLHGLLAENGGGECPACGKEKRRGIASAGPIPIRLSGPRKELVKLCAACLEKIPWVRRAICPICGRPERCGDCLRRTDRHFALCRGAVRYDEVMKDWLWQYKYRGLEKLEPVMAAMLAAAAESILGTDSRIGLVTSVPLASERLEERGFNQAERMALRISQWYGVPYRPLLRRVRNSGKMSFLGRKERFENMRGNFMLIEESERVLAEAIRDREVARLDRKASLNRLDRKERSFGIPFGGIAPGLTWAVSLIRRNNAAEPAASSSGMAPLHVLIVDDIYTTGTTMNECAAALKASPAIREVYGALWARS